MPHRYEKMKKKSRELGTLTLNKGQQYSPELAISKRIFHTFCEVGGFLFHCIIKLASHSYSLNILQFPTIPTTAHNYTQLRKFELFQQLLHELNKTIKAVLWRIYILLFSVLAFFYGICLK